MKRVWRKRLFSIFFSVVFLLSGVPVAGANTEVDTALLNQAEELGLLRLVDAPFRENMDTYLTRLELCSLLAAFCGLRVTPTGEVQFSDLQDLSDQERGIIQAVQGANLVFGYSDGTYRPHDPVSRAQMTALIHRAFNFLGVSLPSEGKTVTFSDFNTVPMVFQSDVMLLAANGIVEPDADGAFHPNIPTARRDALAWLTVSAPLAEGGSPLLSQADNRGLLWWMDSDFSDRVRAGSEAGITRLEIAELVAAYLRLNVEEYAHVRSATDCQDLTDQQRNVVEAVLQTGILDGFADGSFRPTAVLTRGAAAKVVCQTFLGTPVSASWLPWPDSPFVDVPTGGIFTGYIGYCAKKGIVSAYADGTFRSADAASCADVLSWLIAASDTPRGAVEVLSIFAPDGGAITRENVGTLSAWNVSFVAHLEEETFQLAVPVYNAWGRFVGFELSTDIEAIGGGDCVEIPVSQSLDGAAELKVVALDQDLAPLSPAWSCSLP